MKKVGIITHYHGSCNYGGLLQAYALCRVLTDNGIPCEQISYDMTKDHRNANASRIAKISYYARRPLHLVKRMLGEIQRNYVCRKIPLEQLCERRRAVCADFRDQIPHSSTVYTELTISQCVEEYTSFITGSDQVWNPDWYCSPYFLNFVPSQIPKLAYAASLGQTVLSETSREIFRQSLSDFRAVSVRERESVELIQGVCPVSVQWCLDPTMLLTREQWDEICSPRVVEEAYVLCYFLGAGRPMRKAAAAYARRHGLRLITLPYQTHATRKDPLCDYSLGDEQLFEVGPQDFVSLIKHAACIFTDSFHAAVFSSLYEKMYFVFERGGSKGMIARIHTLADLYDARHRICEGKEDFDTIPPIDYVTYTPLLECHRKDSMQFLLDHLT